MCLEQRQDPTGALKSHREAVRINREIESPRALAVALAHRARAELELGHRERARARLDEAKSAWSDRQVDALIEIVEGHLCLADDPRAAEGRRTGPRASPAESRRLDSLRSHAPRSHSPLSGALITPKSRSR